MATPTQTSARDRGGALLPLLRWGGRGGASASAPPRLPSTSRLQKWDRRGWGATPGAWSGRRAGADAPPQRNRRALPRAAARWATQPPAPARGERKRGRAPQPAAPRPRPPSWLPPPRKNTRRSSNSTQRPPPPPAHHHTPSSLTLWFRRTNAPPPPGGCRRLVPRRKSPGRQCRRRPRRGAPARCAARRSAATPFPSPPPKRAHDHRFQVTGNSLGSPPPHDVRRDPDPATWLAPAQRLAPARAAPHPVVFPHRSPWRDRPTGAAAACARRLLATPARQTGQSVS